MSLVFDTDDGLVVFSGCGHAGIVNTIEYARGRSRRAHAYAAIGGFHLLELENSGLGWTAAKLLEFGLRHLLGSIALGSRRCISCAK